MNGGPCLREVTVLARIYTGGEYCYVVFDAAGSRSERLALRWRRTIEEVNAMKRVQTFVSNVVASAHRSVS